MRTKDVVGRWGEELAARYLEESGLTLLERNWRCASGEIDIVARDGTCVVFCEVKTRSGPAFGTPAEAVDRRKAARLRLLAGAWLAAHRPGAATIRFDVVSVLRGRDRVRVEHLRNAF